MKTLRILLTISFTLTAASLVAQSRHFNAQTLGMGNGGTAFIDGYHANFLNPANLMMNNSGRKPKREIGISGFGVQTFGSLSNSDVYDKYFTNGNIIEDELRENMFKDWFDNGNHTNLSSNTNVDVVPFGFSYRGKKSAFSVASRVRTLNTFNINRGFMELAFYGADSDIFGVGKAVNFSSEILSFLEISLGYAREIPIPFTGVIENVPFVKGIKLYVGLAPKYVIGHQAADLNFTSSLQVDPSGTLNQSIIHDFEYVINTNGGVSDIFTSYLRDKELNRKSNIADYFKDYDLDELNEFGGSGFGLDLGVTAEIDVSIPVLEFLGKRQILRTSISLTDLGSIKFDDRSTVISAGQTFVIDGKTGSQKIIDFYENLIDSLETEVYLGFDSNEKSETVYDLPSMFNFGMALTLGKLTTTLDYGYASNDVGKNVKGSSLALGLEYRFVNFIPIRFGTRYGDKATVYSFGTGLDFRNFTFTTGLMAVNDASEGDRLSFAYSGLVVRF